MAPRPQRCRLLPSHSSRLASALRWQPPELACAHMRALLGRDWFVAVLLAAGTFLAFLYSPARDVADSAYALLVSERLLLDGHLNIENYLPEHEEWKKHHGAVIYNVDSRRGHLYYFFPNAGSVLAVPLVAALRTVGFSAVGSDGTWDRFGEVQTQGVISSLLMAAFTALVYLTARLVADRKASVAVALVSAFGTQVWSTTSRAMWSDRAPRGSGLQRRGLPQLHGDAEAGDPRGPGRGSPLHPPLHRPPGPASELCAGAASALTLAARGLPGACPPAPLAFSHRRKGAFAGSQVFRRQRSRRGGRHCRGNTPNMSREPAGNLALRAPDGHRPQEARSRRSRGSARSCSGPCARSSWSRRS